MHNIIRTGKSKSFTRQKIVWIWFISSVDLHCGSFVQIGVFVSKSLLTTRTYIFFTSNFGFICAFPLAYKHFYWSWILAREASMAQCSLVLHCSQGSAGCQSRPTVLIPCSRSTRAGGPWRRIRRCRTGTELASTARRKWLQTRLFVW